MRLTEAALSRPVDFQKFDAKVCALNAHAPTMAIQQRSSARGIRPPATKQPLRAEIDEAASRGYRFYVYTLSDDTGVFYVGKGSAGRVFQHEKFHVQDRNGAKLARVAACLGGPAKAVIAYFNDEGAAYDHERGLIAAGLGELTNMAGGCQSPYEASKGRARAMLARMKTLTHWHMTVRPDALLWCQKTHGSLEAAHAHMVEVLRQEAQHPSPREILIRRDGSWQAKW